MVPEQFMPESDRPADPGRREAARRATASARATAASCELVDWLEDETESTRRSTQTLTYVGSGGVRFFVTISPDRPPQPNMGFILVTVESVDSGGAR